MRIYTLYLWAKERWRNEIKMLSVVLSLLRGIHRWPADSPTIGQYGPVWRGFGALFGASLNKMLNKQPIYGALWRHDAHVSKCVAAHNSWILPLCTPVVSANTSQIIGNLIVCSTICSTRGPIEAQHHRPLLRGIYRLPVDFPLKGH